MGKRSDFAPKVAQKYYTKDSRAVSPLLPFLPRKSKYIEPCAGAGHLIDHLSKDGHECVGAFDILPEREDIRQQDVLFFGFELPPCDLIITNSPWERAVLHEMIEKFRKHAPTYLLFDSDWAFTAQAKPFLPYCSAIITVGRVSWEDNGVSGMENCAWFGFGSEKTDTIFYGKM